MTVIVGIDPGFSGAVAFYKSETHWLEVYDMPVLKNAKGKTVLNLQEQVAAMRGQGVSSMFRFGETYGATQMAVAAHAIPIHYVTPAKWKGHFKLSRDKGVSRSVAIQRFPKNAADFSRVKDDGRAEAALIALYGAEML